MNTDLLNKFRNCKLILLDFDGVLTDNTVIHSSDGTESVIRSRADSLGIDLLSDAGLYDKANYENNKKEIDIVILSREKDLVVASVAKKMKIKCMSLLYDKSKTFDEEIKKRNIDISQVLFIGNDLNDLECIKKAGIGIATADAHPDAIKAADYVTKHRGGKGAFREICELLIKAR